MEKIIFLDFDGVLNSTKWYCKKNRPKSNFDPNAIKLLNYIIDKTNAKIVLSTSWRFDNNIYDLCKNIGIKGEIIGITPSLKFFGSAENISADYICRGNEIAAWLINYIKSQKLNICHWEYPFYVILDDDCDMLLIQKKNFVHINNNTGLTKKNADTAIKILNQNI